MKNLFWKLFPPHEVRLSIDEARNFLSQNAGVCLTVIEPAVIDLLKDADRTIYSIRIDGMKPDHLALMLVTNVIGHAISSGSFHTYRGTLSAIGRDMLTLWHRAQKALLESGYSNREKVEEDNLWIQEQVMNAG